MSLVLESKAGGDFKPHVEGIHPAVCVDVIDLGLIETEFQGQRRLVNKVRVFFETEQRNEEGKNCVISKTFTASLHPKSKLAEFLAKWRGRPVVPGESIDLAKLMGANCTLVISHQQNLVGRTYASIDAISKPTKKVAPSGHYDPALVRQRIAEWKAKEAAARPATTDYRLQTADRGTTGLQTTDHRPQTADRGQQNAVGGAQPKSVAPVAAPAAPVDFDPEVGF